MITLTSKSACSRCMVVATELTRSFASSVHPDDVREIGDRAQWVVPLGLGKFLTANGVTRFVELDWWQSTTLEVAVPSIASAKVSVPSTPDIVSITITCTPAQHWSSRGPLDTNQSLWASFVVRGAATGQSFFHAGDTGYTDGMFRAIGRAYGPIDLALLPIGSYEPRWHLSSQHSNPDDACRIFEDIKARHAIGVHHQTWTLSDEHYLQPAKDLAIARRAHGIADEDFQTVPPGRTLSWPAPER